MLGRVQINQNIPKLRHISCTMCLSECGLTTLETGRPIADQIVFEVLNAYETNDRYICILLRKIEELKYMKLH